MTDRDPARYLADYWPEVTVTTAELVGDRRGQCEWRRGEPPRILLSPDLDAAGRRATLCHEVLHLERGKVDPWALDQEEGEVIRLTARWLLPDAQLVHAAIQEHGLTGAAEVLQVPARVLVNRMRHLTRGEALAVFDPCQVGPR